MSTHAPRYLPGHGQAHTIHVPVEDGGVGRHADSLDRDPLPEHNIVIHIVRLHLALQVEIENLQRPSRCGVTCG